MRKKYFNFRTDMADERVDMYKKVYNLTKIDGVEVLSDTQDGVKTTIVNVLNENGENAVMKEKGKYITMEITDINYLEEKDKEEVGKIVANQVRELIGTDNTKSILVVGLGNIAVTPDALGPKVVKNIEITRHLLNYAKDLVEKNTRSVSAIAPGVLGTTGIETYEIVNSIVQKTNPDMLIVIDSLASKSIYRIGNTIQLSNTGITPGEGVRNKREALNQKSLGIPVIAIGVPTVVDLGTIIDEGLDIFIGKLQEKAESNEYLNKLKEQDNYEEIKEALAPNDYNMIVTPKEIDDLIENMKDVIARGINYAV